MKIYKGTKQYPKEELFGLTSQIRRCAVSIPSNIEEGCCRDSQTEYKRFLQIAMGTASELEYTNKTDYQELVNLINEKKRMLSTLIKKLS